MDVRDSFHVSLFFPPILSSIPLSFLPSPFTLSYLPSPLPSLSPSLSPPPLPPPLPSPLPLPSLPSPLLPSPLPPPLLSPLPLPLPSLSPYRVLFWITEMGIFAKPLNNLEPTRECYTFSNLQAITVDSVNSRLFVAYFMGQELRVATLSYTTFTCDESWVTPSHYNVHTCTVYIVA